jgi:hypothetical protein
LGFIKVNGRPAAGASALPKLGEGKAVKLDLPNAIQYTGLANRNSTNTCSTAPISFANPAELKCRAQGDEPEPKQKVRSQ